MATTTTTTDYNKFIQPYLERLAGKAETLADKPFTPYTGERVAGISGMQEEAMQRIMGLTPSAAGEAGISLAQRAGEQALGLGAGYTPYQTGQFTGDVAQQYMSPYMQNVVDVEKREAQRQADIARTGRQSAATKAGAFGGSRQAIEEAEAQRNLATQLGDIQTKGSQAAYQAAQDMYAKEQQLGEQSRQAGLNAALQGTQAAATAGANLGTLGQTQFGQQSDIISGIGSYGGLQRELEQGKLDVGYGDYAAQQDYPYQQLGFVSDIYNQMPTSQTVKTDTGAGSSGLASLVGGLGSLFSLGKGLSGLNIFNEGGEVKGYAMGGTAEANPMELEAAMKYMPDAGLQKMAQLTDVTELAKAQIAQKLKTNQDIRAAAQVQPQQAQQPTVAEEAVAEMYAGLGGAEMPQDFLNPEMMAGGGIVALAGGGDYDREARRSGAASVYTPSGGLMPGGPMAPPPAPSAKGEPAPDAKGSATPKLDMYQQRMQAAEKSATGLEAINAKYEKMLDDPAYNSALAAMEKTILEQPEYGLKLQKLYEEEGEQSAKDMVSEIWFKAAEAFANFATAKKGEEGEKLGESLGIAAKGISSIRTANAKLNRDRKKDLALLEEERELKKLGKTKDLYEVQKERRGVQADILKSQMDLGYKVAQITGDAAGDVLSAQATLGSAAQRAAGSDPKLTGAYTSTVKAYNDAVSDMQTLANLPNSPLYKSKKALVDSLAQQVRNLEAQMGIQNSILSGGAGVNSAGAGPKEGDVSTSKSGKSIIFRNGQWEYK